MANRKHRKWHRLPGPLQLLVEDLASDHPSLAPKQIYDCVVARKEDGAYEHSEVQQYGEPGLRTVEDIVKKARPPDPSGPWEPTEWENGEDVALVLKVIKYLGENSELTWPTRVEAERILWVRETAPSLPLELVWRLTRRYIVYGSQQLPTKRLAWYLAFKPWESEANKEVYFKVVPDQEQVMYTIDASGSLRGRMSSRK